LIILTTNCKFKIQILLNYMKLNEKCKIIDIFIYNYLQFIYNYLKTIYYLN